MTAAEGAWIDGPVLVHVGLHKTATTWLQEVYFPSHAAGFWVPELEGSARTGAKGLGYHLFQSHDGHLMNEDDFRPDLLRARLAALAPPPGRVPVVSNERLAGHPLSGGFDRNIIARRIKSVFPGARILVTIRAQEELIFSNYLQYLKYGGWHRPEQFLRPPRNNRTPSLALDFWDYEQLSAVYESLFGRGNVLLLPQELLRRDPLSFARRLSAFAGVAAPDSLDASREANARRGVAPSYFLRRLTPLRNKSAANAFVPPLIAKPVDRLVERSLRRMADLLMPRALDRKVSQSLARRIRAVIGDHYLDSNGRFAATQDIDLAALGYRIRTAAA